jgi:hypothetical protein
VVVVNKGEKSAVSQRIKVEALFRELNSSSVCRVKRDLESTGLRNVCHSEFACSIS